MTGTTSFWLKHKENYETELEEIEMDFLYQEIGIDWDTHSAEGNEICWPP